MLPTVLQVVNAPSFFLFCFDLVYGRAKLNFVTTRALVAAPSQRARCRSMTTPSEGGGVTKPLLNMSLTRQKMSGQIGFPAQKSQLNAKFCTIVCLSHPDVDIAYSGDTRTPGCSLIRLSSWNSGQALYGRFETPANVLRGANRCCRMRMMSCRHESRQFVQEQPVWIFGHSVSFCRSSEMCTLRQKVCTPSDMGTCAYTCVPSEVRTLRKMYIQKMYRLGNVYLQKYDACETLYQAGGMQGKSLFSQGYMSRLGSP